MSRTVCVKFQTPTTVLLGVSWTIASLLLLLLPLAKVMGDGLVDCQRPPLNIHPRDCCRMPPLLDEALLAGCKQVHGGEDLKRGPATHERGSCFIECAMNATGTMVDGSLDQVRIMQLIESGTAGSPVLRQIFSVVSGVCFQRMPQTVELGGTGSVGPVGTRKHCSSTAAKFISCVNMETFKICLAEFWTNSDGCITLRKYIQSCTIPT